MDPDKLAMITALGPMIGIGIVAISAGWVLTTWMRIKNGYPLDGAWGQAINRFKDCAFENLRRK